MLKMFEDGVECTIPSCTRCTLTGQNPSVMDVCPMSTDKKDQCNGNCEYYTEIWATEVWIEKE